MHSRVIVPGVVEVVADGSGQQDAQVLLAHLLPQTAELNHAVHHLTHAEAVAEVVERVVSVVLLYACLLYTSPSPRDRHRSRMPSSA